MSFKVRSLILGLLSVMVLGAIVSGPALAEPGPFWHHRAVGGKGVGEKVEKTAPEKFTGKSAATEFESVVGSTAVRLVGEVEVEGTVWNETNQGQGELKTKFTNVKDPALPTCNVTVTVPEPYRIHLMWKYAGNEKELTEQPQSQQKWDGFIIPLKTELLEKGVKENNTFATVGFAGAGCNLLNGIKSTAVGSVAFSGNMGLEGWSQTPTLFFPGQSLWQHYWNGKEFVAIKTGLLFGKEPAKFLGPVQIKFEKQEVAVFEK